MGKCFLEPDLSSEEFLSSSVHIDSNAGPVIKYHHKALQDIKYKSSDLKWNLGRGYHSRKVKPLCLQDTLSSPATQISFLFPGILT